MKRTAFLPLYLILFSAFLCAEGMGESIIPAGIRGSGNVIEEELDMENFSQISISSGMRLDVEGGRNFEVILRADDNVIDVIRVEKDGDLLRFFLPAGTRVSNATMEISVIMPELNGLSMSGGSRAALDISQEGEDFQANLSGGSRLEGRLEADDMEFDLSGGSRITLDGEVQDIELVASGASRGEFEGEARDLQLNLSGGSRFEGPELSARNVDANLSGGSRAEVSLIGTLSADASGGSRLLYRGSPELGKIDTSGGSSVGKR